MADQVTDRRALRRTRALERIRARTGVRLTHHAHLRAREFGVHETQVHECISTPDQSYPCHPSYGPNRRMYQRGTLACVVDVKARVVITVLPRSQERWTHREPAG